VLSVKSLYTVVVVCGLYCGSALAIDDPMRPVPRPGTVQAEPSSTSRVAPQRDWILSSTLIGAGRRVAVINDRLVSVGDEVLGALVIGIDARSAQLRYAGKELVLRLGEHRAEKPRAAARRSGAGQ